LNLQLGYCRPSGTRPLLTNQALYAEEGIGSTVLGQYANQRSANSAAPAGQSDSTEIIYLPTASGPMPIAAEINGRLYAIHTDHLNTPRRLTNPQGQVAWQWLISGFGEVRPTTGDRGYGQTASGPSYAQAVKFDLRYPGQVFDEETGLSYNLHRYYDAATGRYIQADPIGLEGGWNRFGYVGGDPLNAIDPDGLNAVVALNRIAELGRGLYYRYGPAITEFIAGASGVNGAVASPAAINPLVAQIPTGVSRMLPIARGISEGVESGAFCSAKGLDNINIFRAVSPSELKNIQQTGAFQSLLGLQGKYFTTSPAAAAFYAKQAVRGFGDPPYTIVGTRIDPMVLMQPSISATVDGGMPAYVVPNRDLPGLIPEIFNYSPLP
jgi:RHS repeat-associated protein